MRVVEFWVILRILPAFAGGSVWPEPDRLVTLGAVAQAAGLCSAARQLLTRAKRTATAISITIAAAPHTGVHAQHPY